MVELLPLTGDQADLARTVEENFRRVAAVLNGDGGRNLSGLARLVGGQEFEVSVSATADTEIPHDLRRVPRMVVVASALDTAGRLVAAPNGPGGGGNTTAWTADRIYVRATVAGVYALVIV